MDVGKGECLKLLVPYSESESEEVDDDAASKDKVDASHVIRSTLDNFDTTSDSSSDTSSSSSSSESSSSESSDNEVGSDDEASQQNNRNAFEKRKNSAKWSSCKTEGELSIDELPAIEHLNISVNEVDLALLGYVLSVVDLLVIVQSLPEMPALNLDTAIFNEHGDCVGQVFETFGPVRQPLYQLRFNNKDEIDQRKLVPKAAVYYAPAKQEYTEFVFAEMLRRTKGSDASWKNDNEPPEDKLDYSDDEEERMAKLKRKNKLPQDPNATSPVTNCPRTTARGVRRLRRGSRGGMSQSEVPLQQNSFSSFRHSASTCAPALPPLSFMSQFWRSVPPPQMTHTQRFGIPSVPNYWTQLPPPPPPPQHAQSSVLLPESVNEYGFHHDGMTSMVVDELSNYVISASSGTTPAVLPDLIQQQQQQSVEGTSVNSNVYSGAVTVEGDVNSNGGLTTDFPPLVNDAEDKATVYNGPQNSSLPDVLMGDGSMASNTQEQPQFT